jgi:hypothetical protein
VLNNEAKSGSDLAVASWVLVLLGAVMGRLGNPLFKVTGFVVWASGVALQFKIGASRFGPGSNIEFIDVEPPAPHNGSHSPPSVTSGSISMQATSDTSGGVVAFDNVPSVQARYPSPRGGT